MSASLLLDRLEYLLDKGLDVERVLGLAQDLYQLVVGEEEEPDIMGHV